MQLPLDETECTLNFMDECMLQMQSAGMDKKGGDRKQLYN
jgi:hypothetical protein